MSRAHSLCFLISGIKLKHGIKKNIENIENLNAISMSQCVFLKINDQIFGDMINNFILKRNNREILLQGN